MTNPFADGENRVLRPPATALVIFGATGDLTQRKLIPALYNLAHDGFLPARFLVIGASRSPWSDDDFRARSLEAVRAHSRREIVPEVWERFATQLYYQPLNGRDPADFAKLAERLRGFSESSGECYNYLYYLATSPSFIGDIAANLNGAGLVEDVLHGARRTAIVVEKPFGDDLASARALNTQLRQHFKEEQIYRIDHYLGKETVQNILVLRFANGIFEPLWNGKYIDHIQVSVCESIGVGSRAGYFDQAGILRDIVQNHLLQMLALLCIEPPNSLSDADCIRDEKVKVLRAMQRMTAEEVGRYTVRGQYGRGFINGKEVKAYADEDGISASSQTETYVALRLAIDNWRWAGVPIYVRAGKRLPKRITEITVYFKKAPGALFKGRQIDGLQQNVLAIQVQPEEGVALKVISKAPGPRMRVEAVEMDFSYHRSFGTASADAYERLLLDAMKGDATLFTRGDEIEEAWDLLAPVLEGWSAGAGKVYSYEAGTWGPAEADALLSASGHSWRVL